MDPKEEIKALLEQSLTNLGAQIKASVDELAEYAEAQAKIVAATQGTPGFDLTLQAARDNVALRAGIITQRDGARAKNMLLGVLHSAIFMAARMIVLGGAP